MYISLHIYINCDMFNANLNKRWGKYEKKRTG